MSLMPYHSFVNGWIDLLNWCANDVGTLVPFLRLTAVDRGFFFWQRVFFGILGPAAFAYMVRETARLRSTQSATGILYMALIFVVYGEFLARYLTVAGAGPM